MYVTQPIQVLVEYGIVWRLGLMLRNWLHLLGAGMVYWVEVNVLERDRHREH